MPDPNPAPDAAPPTLYALIGGASAVQALVDRFYDHMDRRPESAAIRAMHPADLAGSREKLYLFLTGWLGGPPLYMARHGHPRLRARHLPFAVDTSARDQWMVCMRLALAETVAEEDLRGLIDGALARLADHMRNTEG